MNPKSSVFLFLLLFLPSSAHGVRNASDCLPVLLKWPSTHSPFLQDGRFHSISLSKFYMSARDDSYQFSFSIDPQGNLSRFTFFAYVAPGRNSVLDRINYELGLIQGFKRGSAKELSQFVVRGRFKQIAEIDFVFEIFDVIDKSKPSESEKTGQLVPFSSR